MNPNATFDTLKQSNDNMANITILNQNILKFMILKKTVTR